MNICSPDPVISPSSVVKGYPVELESIVMKAMNKNRDLRFATANDMQKALDALPGNLRASTDDELGDYMKALLPERMVKRQLLIQRALKDAERRLASPGTPDEVSSGQLTPLSGVSHVSQIVAPHSASSTGVGIAIIPEATVTLPEPAPGVPAVSGSGRAMRTLGAVALAAVTGGAVYLATSRPAAGPDPAAGAAAAVAQVVSEPVAAPTPPPSAIPTPPVAAEEPSAQKVVDMNLEEPEADMKTGKTRAASHTAAKWVPPHIGAKVAEPKAAPAAPATAPAAPAKPGSKPFVSPFKEPDF
jgi:serine/threonine-protein kinase